MNLSEEDIDKLFTYHAPTEESKRKLQLVREWARSLAKVINYQVPDCADKSASIRLLREAVMTANAAIVLNQPLSNPELPNPEPGD